MKLKVLVTAVSFGRTSTEPAALLENAGCEIIRSSLSRPMNEEELLAAVPQVDAIITGADIITRRVIESARRLRVIAKHGVGVDNIDVQCATERGIVVTNAPGSNADSVADLAFGLMLALARRIPQADRFTRSGEWDRFIGVEVWGKTIGIVGLGRIGKGIAVRARGFNMEVLACDVFHDEPFAIAQGITFVSFEELLGRADFVTLNVPLGPDTRGMVNSRTLRLMKRGAYLINTARGEIVDEAALAEALQNGLIAGAAVDVYVKEPPGESPLFSLPNVIVTPHMGAHTAEAARNAGLVAANCVVDALAERRPAHLVNPQVYSVKRAIPADAGSLTAGHSCPTRRRRCSAVNSR